MSHLREYLERNFPARLFRPAELETGGGAGQRGGKDAEKKMAGKVKTKTSLQDPELDRQDAEGSIKPWSDKDLAEHFMKYFGVTVRGTGQHYLFKYYFILQGKRWTHPVTGDCRGTIMMRNIEPARWKVACRPCAKFFNQQETHCPVFTKEAFEKSSDEYVLVEKADGTMISLWWREDETNPENGAWQVSTSTVVSAGPEWLAMLKPMLDISDSKIIAALRTNYTYIIELCSKSNRVLTKYPDDRAYLLVVIDTDTGSYAPLEEVDRMAQALHLFRPKYFHAKDEGIRTLDSFLEWVEDKSRSPEFPPNPEGFVVYWDNAPLCKLKNTTYTAKHPFHSLSYVSMKLNILERFWEKTTDDVADVIPPPIQKYLEELTAKVNALIQLALETGNKLLSVSDEEKAILVAQAGTWVKRVHEQCHTDAWLASYFLKSREFLLGIETPKNQTEFAMHDQRSHFVEYLEKNWRGKLPYWKNTSVPEIVDEEREFGAGGRAPSDDN